MGTITLVERHNEVRQRTLDEVPFLRAFSQLSERDRLLLYSQLDIRRDVLPCEATHMLCACGRLSPVGTDCRHSDGDRVPDHGALMTVEEVLTTLEITEDELTHLLDTRALFWCMTPGELLFMRCDVRDLQRQFRRR